MRSTEGWNISVEDVVSVANQQEAKNYIGCRLQTFAKTTSVGRKRQIIAINEQQKFT